MRTLLSLIMTVILIMGCTRQAPSPVLPDPPPPSAVPEPAPPAPSQPEPGVSARSLFPEVDLRYQFYVDEAGGAQRPVTEELLVEPGRAVAVYNGAPYAEWRFRHDGVWREDPETGVLLRYLPPELKSGMAWKQQNGGGTAWFYLERGQDKPFGFAGPAWLLTKLEGGGRITFTFMPGYGVVSAGALSWRDPEAGFAKYLRTFPPEKLGEYPERSRAPAFGTEGTPAPVEPVTVAEFEQASRETFLALMGVMAEVDLNDDGRPEYLGAAPGQWVQGTIPIYHADGTFLYSPTQVYKDVAMRLQPIRLKGIPLQLLLWEVRETSGGAPMFSLLYMRNGQMDMAYGWAPKAQFGAGDRVAFGENGEITAWWHMGDPAGHTRVTRYQAEYRDGGVWAGKMSVDYVPTADALRYPEEPLAVLQAAFVARWFGLTDELPRYFGSAEAAAPLVNHPDIVEPYYGPGRVELGTVALPLPTDPVYGAKVVPGEVGPDGWAPFVADVGFYESSQQIWGRARFGRNPAGLPVIEEIIFEGNRFSGI